MAPNKFILPGNFLFTQAQTAAIGTVVVELTTHCLVHNSHIAGP